MRRMQHCFNCGAPLGVYDGYPGDIEHCGKPACAREAQYEYGCRDTAAREDAAEDNYNRYR